MKEKLKQILENYLKEKNILSEVNITVPNDKDNGDFSTNLALQLTKSLKRNPLDIADEIVSSIKLEEVEKIEIKKPGFINFFISKTFWTSNINKILESAKDYGRSTVGNNEKVDIEFVSANPTGNLHVGHVRGATYGDSLARIMTFAGYDVTKEYYINDLGNQINNLGISLKARYLQACGEEASIPEDGYHGKEIILLGQKMYDEHKDTLKGKDIDYFKQVGLQNCMDVIKKDLTDLNVTFDVFVSEKSLYESGEVENTLRLLKDKNVTYEEDGALWLKTSAYGDDKDRVLIKKDGDYTYLTPDIANHAMKFKRGFDKLINVWGADHYGYIKRMKVALDMIGYDSDNLDVRILQMVRLIENGVEVKMSKRTGKSVTLRELLDEIGKDALRYLFVTKRLDTQMDFDMNLATKKSNDNPVYYIFYAYARICSILEKYDKKIKIENYKTFDQNAYSLLGKIYEFPYIVQDSAKKRLPHLIANYVYELATEFHSFYSSNRIITDSEEKNNENINLIKVVKITLENSLDLLGVVPPKKM